MSKVTAQQLEGWKAIVTKPYADQNGFWADCEKDAELVWTWVETFVRLDLQSENKKGKDGCDLDEFWSHKFLETLGETMTVVEMREKFRKIDADFNKRMSIIEYLMFRYKKGIQEVIDAPQGDNKDKIAEAQAKVAEAQAAVEQMVARLEEQKAATAAAKAAAEEARAAAEAAAASEAEATRTAQAASEAAAEAKAAADAADAVAAPYRAAVAENEAALKELKAQEDAYSNKKAALEAAKNDQSSGVVKRNKAANELDQLLAEDPLPLRRAKINQQATLKKMEKAAAPFNEASAKANAAAEVSAAAAAEAEAAAEKARQEKAKADEAHAQSEAAAEAAEEAKRQVEAAVKEAEDMLQEAVNFLEEVKKKGGIAHGAIWWMERQIEEKRRYMPGYKSPRTK